MALNGAHNFQYWLIEVNDLKYEIIFNNSNDDVDISSSKPNGINDIDLMNYNSWGIEYRYDRYKYYGNKYVLAECLMQKNMI